MKQNLLELFHIPVMLFNDVITRYEASCIINELREKVYLQQRHGYFKGTASTSFSLEGTGVLSDYPKYKDKIQNCLDLYADEVGIGKTEIWLSWFAIQEKDSLLLEHIHGGSTLNGILYLQTDEDSSPLIIRNPREYDADYCFWNKVKETKHNLQTETIQPKIGDLVVMPSNIPHGNFYNNNQSDERIIIGFDTKYFY
jgi:hypothetical protein